MNLEKAIVICKSIEAVSPSFGCHVALTGGCLYKQGERKDLDILFYRIRQVEKIDKDGLLNALGLLGFKDISGFGWIHKASVAGYSVDMFFPEEQQGEEYDPEYGQRCRDENNSLREITAPNLLTPSKGVNDSE